ncbi:MAG: vWA domain-containing protein, partial [Candidatus Kapaibacteriota bacterium]
IMKTTLSYVWIRVLCCLAILFNGSFLMAQFPETISVPSFTGKPVQSSLLKPGVRYKVTVSGTYSMWRWLPNIDSIGVDANYIYDVPRSEIEAMRWPEEQYIIYPLDTVTSLPLPKWVGSDTIFPPNNPIISILFPLYKFDFRKHMGFRIDGTPMLPRQSYNPNNIYSYVTVGQGKSLTFQILDSVISVVSGRTLPAYLDNSGHLTVRIEETKSDSIYVDECGDHIAVDSSKFMRLGLNIALLRNAFDPNSKPYNLLKEGKFNKIGLLDRGIFYCADSMSCTSEIKGSLALSMVFDRSGSMLFDINQNTGELRADAARSAGISFVNKLSDNDRLSIISFANNVTIDKPWSTKNQTPTAINTINSIYANVNGRTAFYAALIEAINQTQTQTTTKKAIIALTDGVNNISPDTTAVFNAISKSGTLPIYIVALGFDQTEPGIKEALDNMREIAKRSNGKLFTVQDSAELIKVYDQLSTEVRSEECCTVYFKVSPCDSTKSDTVRTATIYYMDNGTVKTKDITYKTPCKKLLAGMRMRDIDPSQAAKLKPIQILKIINAQQFVMNVPQHAKGMVTIELYDSDGIMIGEIYKNNHKAGKQEIPLKFKGIEKGLYRAVIRVNGEMIHQLPVEVVQ